MRSDAHNADSIQQKIQAVRAKIRRGHEIPELKAVTPMSVPGYPVSLRLPLLRLPDVEKKNFQEEIQAYFLT